MIQRYKDLIQEQRTKEGELKDQVIKLKAEVKKLFEEHLIHENAMKKFKDEKHVLQSELSQIKEQYNSIATIKSLTEELKVDEETKKQIEIDFYQMKEKQKQIDANYQNLHKENESLKVCLLQLKEALQESRKINSHYSYEISLKEEEIKKLKCFSKELDRGLFIEKKVNGERTNEYVKLIEEMTILQNCISNSSVSN